MTSSLTGLLKRILPSGEAYFYGTVTLDGSNPTAVTLSDIAKIKNATVTMKQPSAPGDDPVLVTCDWSGADNVLNIYAWKHDGVDPTLVASTNSSVVVAYQGYGTSKQ